MRGPRDQGAAKVESVQAARGSGLSASGIDRAAIEDYLFHEAALIDEWRLEEWLGLFTPDARYLVHSGAVDVEASPDTTLFYIADDMLRLRERVHRLGKRTAFAEFPHSRTRHYVANVRAVQGEPGEILVRCNMMVHRWRDRADVFSGMAAYRLRVDRDGGLAIGEKRCALDAANLNAQGRVSIIL